MTIRHLKTFCAVCRLGGITRAAEELCVAQPSVSQTVSELERYYGVKLFDRMGRKLLLTPEGERLRVKAEEAIAAFSEFEEAARDTMERRSVRIGTSVTVGQMLLPRLVRALKEEMGNVECRAVVESAAAVEKLVEEGALDFAAVEGSVSRGLIAEEFASDRLAAVCAAAMDIRGPILPARLVEHPLLLRRKGSASRDLLEERLSALGLKPQPWLESSSNSALLAAAREGLGIAVLPEAIVASDLAAGRLREVTVEGLDLSRRWFAVRRQDRKFSPAQKAAYNLLFSLARP